MKNERLYLLRRNILPWNNSSEAFNGVRFSRRRRIGNWYRPWGGKSLQAITDRRFSPWIQKIFIIVTLGIFLFYQGIEAQGVSPQENSMSEEENNVYVSQ